MLGNIAFLAAGLGAGLCVLGAAIGIGRVSGAAMEGTARQPAAGNDLRTNMVLGCSFVEGAALFGLVICLLLAFK